jgi:transposase
MAPDPASPARFIGLDIHKEYFVAAGVNAAQERVFGPQRVPNVHLDEWLAQHITRQDAVVLEMTTNTYLFYDALLRHVHSVTVVHPPHVALVVRAQVKTDRKAALGLAQLHAAGLLTGVWIPPHAVRDLRALIAQRYKMVRLASQAKCRLDSALHRHHLARPAGSQPYHPKHREWWLGLPLSPTEQTNLECDWATVEFAEGQKRHLEERLAQVAAQDARVPLLAQLTGIGWLSAITLLAAIGTIERFERPEQLVGYAGLGARVHDSGKVHTTGRITKAGRRDLRRAMVDAAQHAARNHPHWKVELARLEPRLGRSKAIVAIARKLLVVVWHVLTEEAADRFADERQVACSFFALAYKLGVKNLPEGQSALQFTRSQLDRLGLGRELTHIPWGSKRFRLPPSRLAA